MGLPFLYLADFYIFAVKVPEIPVWNLESGIRNLGAAAPVAVLAASNVGLPAFLGVSALYID